MNTEEINTTEQENVRTIWQEVEELMTRVEVDGGIYTENKRHDCASEIGM